MKKIAIVMSHYYPEICQGLLFGAREYLEEQKIPFDESDLFQSPGAFETPLIAQKLAQTNKYAGIICLGCVIKGDTFHFEMISLGATIGIMQSMLATSTPISFGILTTQTEQQALVRSKKNTDNKGREAAAACVNTIRILAGITA